MSKSLYYRPIVPTEEKILPPELKRILAKRLFDSDGSLNCEEEILTKDHNNYLTGLADAGVFGAQELLDAISAHGMIAIWIGE